MIRLVEARGYKSLRYVRQSLEPFQILVGPNASGKSTLLDVIGFFRDLLLQGAEETVRKRARSLQELVWNRQGESFELAIECTLPRELRESRSPYQAARYEVRVEVDTNGISAVVENLWLTQKAIDEQRGNETARAKMFEPPETIVIEPRKHSPAGWRKVMSRNPEGRIYIRSETTDWNFSLRPAKGVVGLAVVPEEERFEVAVWVRQLLLRRIQTLMLQSQHMRYPCPPDAPTEFEPDGSNLPIAIARLRETQPKQFERWLDHVRTVFSNIQDIVVKEREEDRYRYIEAHFKGGMRVPSWLLSDGTLRFLALTLIAYLPEENRVYLIEEPENGIHPRALEAVYQSLSSVYHSQILCATHSPLLLNMAEPRHLLCFSHQQGATTIVRGDQHPFLKDWKKEVSLGNLLASGVLG